MLLFSLFLVVGLPVAVNLALWVWKRRAGGRSVVAVVADIDNATTKRKSDATILEEQKRQQFKAKALEALQRYNDLIKDQKQMEEEMREFRKDIQKMDEKNEKFAADVKEFSRGVDRFQTQLAIGLTAVVTHVRSTGSFPGSNTQRSTHSSTSEMTTTMARLVRQRGNASGRRGISSDYKRQ